LPSGKEERERGPNHGGAFVPPNRAGITVVSSSYGPRNKVSHGRPLYNCSISPRPNPHILRSSSPVVLNLTCMDSILNANSNTTRAPTNLTRTPPRPQTHMAWFILTVTTILLTLGRRDGPCVRTCRPWPPCTPSPGGRSIPAPARSGSRRSRRRGPRWRSRRRRRWGCCR
jgi:hypothetical protein